MDIKNKKSIELSYDELAKLLKVKEVENVFVEKNMILFGKPSLTIYIKE